ncbi:MAG: CHAP domain-containing protein [bacterium]|nr:CHAP domain-containing protein [bacterium]
MNDFTQQIAQLRGASIQFQQSAASLQHIVEHVGGLMDDLNAVTSSTASDTTFGRYQGQRGWITEWAGTLERFAERLSQAADEIEWTAQTDTAAQADAGAAHDAPFSADGQAMPTPGEPAANASDTPSLRRPSSVKLDFAPKAAPPPPAESDYLSPYNRVRMDALMQAQILLPEREAALDQIAQERTAAALSARMLSERLAAETTTGDLQALARQQARLRDLDAAYQAARGEVEQLRAEADTLSRRLDLLMPEPGANTRLIQAMENGRSPEWLKDNTYDCVRYVVGRVNIPPELARDAYLWDDQAEVLREYGLRMGAEPMPGSILVMERAHPYADDVFGHVMVVERVDANGDVWVTDNFHPTEPVLLRDLTDETRLHLRYLYLPWHTRA